MAEGQAAQPLAGLRPVGDVDLETGPAGTDQVVADVRRLGVHAFLFGGPAGDFDRPQRGAHLGFAGRLGQLFDRVAVAVPAGKSIRG